MNKGWDIDAKEFERELVYKFLNGYSNSISFVRCLKEWGLYPINLV